jgi:origin recognition complex subunit 5
MTASNDPLNPLTTAVLGLELPYYAKYLLIAAFLASFNSPKHDRRLFMKYHGKERKRLNNKNKKHQVKMSSLLVGPKPFNFERLSAIFHAIADVKSTLSTNVCAQVNITIIQSIKVMSS